MEPNGIQSRIRFNIMSALETERVFRMTGEEALATLPHFHVIDSMPETSGTELAWAILHSIGEVVIAFRADGVYCLFSNVFKPEMYVSSSEEELRNFVALLPPWEPAAKQAYSAALNAMRRRLNASELRFRLGPTEPAMLAANV